MHTPRDSLHTSKAEDQGPMILYYDQDYIFGANANKRMRKNFHSIRTRLAYRTQNRRIKQIHLHSFRQCFACMLYHHSKNSFQIILSPF